MKIDKKGFVFVDITFAFLIIYKTVYDVIILVLTIVVQERNSNQIER